MGGLILAAPASGSGKTTVTLGLLRAAVRGGAQVRSAKSGPDYIDPRFHEAASNAPCVNLDAWAMSPDRLRTLAHHKGSETILIEGAMGLFDGAPPDNRGSTADLARILGLPVVLVVDAARMSGSIAPLVTGFMQYDPTVQVAGVILNNVGSARHERMLRSALVDVRIFGAVPRDTRLSQPSRHLGLMQASERPDLEAFLDIAADAMAAHIDINALLSLSMEYRVPRGFLERKPPPAQRIAIAQDVAFGFTYPHQLDDWRAQGAEITFFSPLADEAVPKADYVFLPGGYPELHAGKLAANTTFTQSLQNSAQYAEIYGECGGYMVLGDSLTDAQGTVHPMSGLLRLQTSFAQRKLHLGYRTLIPCNGDDAPLKGHEFHYATTLHAKGDPLFHAYDAEDEPLGPIGLRQGRVSGSFAHLI